MKKVSLLKITIIVVTAAVASLTVKANDKIAIDNQVVEKLKQTPAKFSQLDSDNNGLLTQDELGLSENSALKKVFVKIDSNKDSVIDEAEFNAFVIQVKNNLSKSEQAFTDLITQIQSNTVTNG